MADSTELTFVRCPHCRSLVPAVAKTCRMCGESLEAQTEDPDSSAERKSNRIRQRTMSKPSEELNSTAARLRQEEAKPAEQAAGIEVADPEADSASQQTFEDPLSAYIEEVDLVSQKDRATVEPVEDFFQTQEESPSSASVEPEESKITHLTQALESETPEQLAAPTSEPSEVEAPLYKPKVIIESGGKKGVKSGNFSFSRKQENEKSEPVNNQIQSEETMARSSENRDSTETNKKEATDKEVKSEAAKTTSNKTKATKKSADGRLFGWLVSYLHSEGEAIELREGKFFVSRSSLKPSDLVLDDESVSTPHGLVTVSSESGLRVQDLMSERGVFVRRRDADSYQKVSEVVELNHGDWIRFGDVEFLASLVAHVGAAEPV